jgi:hypothetical protein
MLGGLIGAGGGTAFALLTLYVFSKSTWFGVLLLVGGSLVAVLPLYLVGNRTASADRVSAEFMTGALLGLNVALNAILLGALIHPLAAMIPIVLLVPAWVPSLARTDVYQAFIGWGNFVFPMSWLVTGLGLAFMLVSALLYGVTIGRVGFLKIHRFFVDFKTGTFFLLGGLAGNANLRAGSPGYNMGNFAFLRGDAAAEERLVEHEAGHGLNLAAFGFVFHFIGAVDENITGGHENAYAERFAESNVPSTAPRAPILPLWGA